MNLNRGMYGRIASTISQTGMSPIKALKADNEAYYAAEID
jgi:hypothetical protein